MTEKASLYAGALIEIVQAEGNVNVVREELLIIANEIERNEELRQTLSDPHIPAALRQQIVEDVLKGNASDTSLGIMSMLVATGRTRELSTIVERFKELTETRSSKALAEVRSAVELTESQRERLGDALKSKLGRDVDIVVVVDPSLVGGVVTQVGDQVIDGSVRTRLSQLKEAF